ncbi:MAG: sigma-54-dependent Fis family transcriptional regulator [Planctomycetota bacterium]|nr:sigma-54-dependent Fis family transcriptional regulator [Planctomycetota bacterium]
MDRKRLKTLTARSQNLFVGIATERDLAVAEEFLDTCEKAGLSFFEALRRDNENLRSLLEISRKLGAPTPLPDLLEQILDTALSFTGAERAFLLYNPQGDETSCVQVARHFDQRDISSPDLEISSTLANQVIQTGQPILTGNATTDPQWASIPSIRELRLRSILCVPIPATKSSMGALYLDNRFSREAFNTSHCALIEAFAAQVGTALERAYLHDQVRSHLETVNRDLQDTVDEQNEELTQVHHLLQQGPSRLRTPDGFADLIGQSEPMETLYLTLERIAPTDLSVLILGESGTGKELVARALHRASPRHNGPFISENCAALNPSLLESELFGHVEGAYTGAHQDRAGLFERAEGGTLFLDEIGDMPIQMQTRLLRALQEKEVRRVGGKSTIPFDVRIIAASNRNLHPGQEMEFFRDDLFHRLSGMTIHLVPLRDRPGDISLLAHHFLEAENRNRPRQNRLKFTPRAQEALNKHTWPGNIRELQNVIARSAALAPSGGPLEKIVLDSPSSGLLSQDIAHSETIRHLGPLLERIEREEIHRALENTGGNRSRAADLLGISRYALKRKMIRFENEARPTD